MSLTFKDAAEKVKTLKSDPGQEEKLELYGLFKQGTNDPTFENAKKPGMMDFTGKAKYKAWEKVVEKGTTPEQAQAEYIAVVEKLIEKYGLK